MIKGLEDIAPIDATVSVGKGSVTVRGVSLRGVVSLVSRFQSLAGLFNGQSVSAEQLLVAAPDAAAAIMAAGAGYIEDLPSRKEAEQLFDTLPVEYQVEILGKVIELTFPGGFGPFVERISQISSSLNVNVGAVAQNVTVGSQPSLSG